jgi:hypothetical protein
MTLVSTITTKAFDMKVNLVKARIGGDTAAAKALVTASATAEHESSARFTALLDHPLTMWLIVAFATPLALFVWKVVVVDIIIGPGCIWFTHACWVGSTDPIKGQVADWATSIIYCLFGSSSVLAAGKMYFGRDKTGE